MKIICIAGDGRSGSTILDSILSNIPDSVSVGECARYWLRFNERDTLCGCGKKIEECELWSGVDKILNEKFVNYDILEVISKVNQIRSFKNFKKIPEFIINPEWSEFCNLIISFFKAISQITGKETIIDSSKYPSWVYFISQLNFCEIKIIHLERNLQSVANSWKKTIYLPEYYDKQVMMPIKSNYVILKNWTKVKYLSAKLKSEHNYFFINYEEFCRNVEIHLKKLEIFLEVIPFDKNLIMQINHSIGGNPVRSNIKKYINIVDSKDKLENLNFFEVFYFNLLNILLKRIIL